MHNGAGVTSSNEGLDGIAWNVVGHIYRPKLVSADAFVWHAEIPAETFVPPHVHPHQDEWIYVLSGALEVDFGFEAGNVQPHRAGAGTWCACRKASCMRCSIAPGLTRLASSASRPRASSLIFLVRSMGLRNRQNSCVCPPCTRLISCRRRMPRRSAMTGGRAVCTASFDPV